MLEMREESELSEFIGRNKDALVLFFASWCPSCRAFKPVFEKEVAKSRCATAAVCLDDNENPLWDRYDVEYVPTVAYFKKGSLTKRLVESPGTGLGRDEFVRFLKSLSAEL